jgi:3D (Asp-Asp-Asp) domain-containing protein
MGKSLLMRSIILGLILGISFYGLLKPHVINADFEKVVLETYKVTQTRKVVVTAYSSTPDQTDDTPLITASGKHVADGVIANNRFKFGTKIRFPELYGDKVFTVYDRMHKRKGLDHVDIWFPEYKQAKNFGAKITTIEVLEEI